MQPYLLPPPNSFLKILDRALTVYYIMAWLNAAVLCIGPREGSQLDGLIS